MTLVTIRRDGSRPNPSGFAAFADTSWQDRADSRRVQTGNEASDRLASPPKPLCPFTGAHAVLCAEFGGRSALDGRTIVHTAPGAFAQLAPYRVCIVASNEGQRAAGALICDSDPQIDGEVEAAALLHDDRPQMGFVQ